MSNPSSKLHLRLQSAIEGKRFYEAHQIYKTVYFRCMTKKNYSDAIQHLFAGANFLLSNKQWESGAELARLLTDVYAKSKLDLTDTHLEQMCKLLEKVRSGDDRNVFVQKATSVLNSDKRLLGRFNERYARLLWSEGSFSEARYRIMLSLNGYAVGAFLVALHQRCGLRSEIDLFVTQAVLQFLCMRQFTVATVTYYAYTRGHPRLEPGPPFMHFPLLNFLWFLMLAIEQKAAVSVFSVLCDKYGPQLRRDASFIGYLDKIGQLYFNIEPPHKDNNNLFSNLMKLFGGDDGNAGDLSESNEPLPSTSHSDAKSNSSDKMFVEDVD